MPKLEGCNQAQASVEVGNNCLVAKTARQIYLTNLKQGNIMQDTITVYSTEDVKKNKLMRKKVEEQDRIEAKEREIEEQLHYDYQVFSELEDAVGYDRALELTDYLRGT